MTARPPRMLRTAAVVAALAVAVAGCGIRAETPPLERRTPEPSVVVRDDAALREQAVLDAAAGATSMLAAVERATAPARLDVIGPVYVELPGATPSPDDVPLTDAVLRARDGALAAADATEDAPLVVLMRATALGHSLALAAGFAAETEGWPEMTERTAGVTSLGDALTPATADDVGATVIADLALAHDRAGFAYEVAAARAADAERAAWLERAALHRARAEALATMAGVTDLREELYDVAPAAVGSEDARISTARATETALGAGYAVLVAKADGALGDASGWLYNACYDAYAAAFALPGLVVADVPALPGVVAGP